MIIITKIKQQVLASLITKLALLCVIIARRQIKLTSFVNAIKDMYIAMM